MMLETYWEFGWYENDLHMLYKSKRNEKNEMLVKFLTKLFFLRNYLSPPETVCKGLQQILL